MTLLHSIRSLTLIPLLAASATLMAQQDVPAPAAAPAAPEANSCPMHHCWEQMMKAPKRGFHSYIEWGGIYGGPSNQVSVRMAGHTYNMDMRDRDAVRVGAGYQFNPYIYVGGGFGAEFQYKAYTDQIPLDNRSPPVQEYSYTNYTGSLWVLPIYAEVKYFILKKPISPFLQMRMGYAPAVYDADGHSAVESSFYDNMSVGVRIYSHLSITAGYLFRYQPTSVLGYDRSSGVDRIMTNTSSPIENRFTLGIAMSLY